MRTIVTKTLKVAAIAASLAFAGAASAVPISVGFNFVPFGTINCTPCAPPGDVTVATACGAGAPDTVTVIDLSILNNTGLVSGQNLTITDPTPLLVGNSFTKTFTTPVGTFTELLTVDARTPGPTSLGIAASGTISCTGVCAGGTLTSTPVFYSAAYTQNGGPSSQINASFNNSTTPPGGKIPEPATLALLGLGLAAFGFMRRRRQQ
jgi:hypothetical protein